MEGRRKIEAIIRDRPAAGAIEYPRFGLAQKHHIDFRRVYATALDAWFGVDSQSVLGERFEPLDVLKA